MGLFHNIYESVELGHFNWPFRNRQVVYQSPFQKPEVTRAHNPS